MKNTYITIVGTLPIQFDLHESMRIGPVVASSNNNKTITFPYATVNSEQNLQDMLNSPVFKNTKLLCPEELSNPIELSRLKSIAISNPATKFMYICNPPRTYQLDDLENGFCDNYIKYQEFIDARK